MEGGGGVSTALTPDERHWHTSIKRILDTGSRRTNGPTAERWLDEDEMFAALAACTIERKLTFDYGRAAKRATPESVRRLTWLREDIERNRRRRLMVVVP